jgi:hypothetical protein
MRAMPTLALILFFVPFAAPARAEDTFDDLVRKIHQGQTVIVIDQQGGRTQGRVESVSATALVVNFGQRQTFTPADVRQVKRPDRMWDGAIKGAAFGIIPAVLVGALDCDDCVPGWMAALAVGSGAGIGFAIDALCGPKTVFRGSSQPSRVTVAPIIGRDRRGVAASFRF